MLKKYSMLEIEGVVFTMYDARTNLSLQVVENVKENLDKNIYKTIIPRNVRLAEAPSYGMPINMYDSRSAGAEAYRYLAYVAKVGKHFDGVLCRTFVADDRNLSIDNLLHPARYALHILVGDGTAELKVAVITI